MTKALERSLQQAQTADTVDLREPNMASRERGPESISSAGTQMRIRPASQCRSVRVHGTRRGSLALIEALPAIDPHPLATEYRAELDSRRVADRPESALRCRRPVSARAVAISSSRPVWADIFDAADSSRPTSRPTTGARYPARMDRRHAARLPTLRSQRRVERRRMGTECVRDWLAHPELERFRLIAYLISSIRRRGRGRFTRVTSTSCPSGSTSSSSSPRHSTSSQWGSSRPPISGGESVTSIWR